MLSLCVVGKDEAPSLRQEGREAGCHCSQHGYCDVCCHCSAPAMMLGRIACGCEASCWYSADHVSHHDLQLD